MRTLQLFICVLLLQSLAPAAAYAYIDPGTGSQMIQILIAAVLGGAFAIKCWWQNVKAFLRSKFSSSAQSKSEDNGEGKK